MKKRLTILMLILAIVASLFVGCAKEAEEADTTATEEVVATAEPTEAPTQEPTQEPLEVTTIVDFLGNELEIPQEQPNKIISLTPSNTEILFALGLGEYVIGVDSYSDYPEAALEIEKVGDFNGPNVETILALEPDVVFAGNTLQADAIAQLQDVGVKVVAAEATSYEDIYQSISLIGELTLTNEQAQEVKAQMLEQENKVVAMAQEYDGEPMTAYYTISAGEYGNWTSGPGSLINDMFAMLNIEVITDIEPSAPWMDFSLETLVAEDPDVLLLSSMAFMSVEDLCALEGYKELTACKEGGVIMVNGAVTERPSVRIVEGLEEIYNAVYGN